MSLADELLADLEDAGDLEEDQLYQQDTHIQEVEDVIPLEIDTKVKSVRAIAKLRDSEELARVMSEIKQKVLQARKEEVTGPVEADPEYQLIVEANNLAVEIDNEINIIHKFTRDNYQKRFPELESLVPGALDYVLTVKELGNSLEKAKNNEVLQSFLTPATIMVVSVTASTTQGQLLSQEELTTIFEACDMALELNDFKLEIYSYVESRMSFIAPNLSQIVGASVAAKLMGVAGGLTNLSKMPACNVLVLGSQKRTLSGFSSTAVMPHTGFVYYTDIVQNTPADLRRKASRLLAAKCVLAARVDSFHESPDGTVGVSLREEVERKLDKLQEPPPVKQVKPLPPPIDQNRKKRGGRRVRRMKERFAVTELRKQANRMSFGEIEEDAYQEDLGFSSGQIGKAGAGRIRSAQVDEKTKVRISKTLQKNLQRQQVYGGSTTVRRHVSGTASSVAFTPLQGLEIVNPHAAEAKASDSGAKYFSNTAGFLKIAKQ
ncbi:pre-mRNA processing factor 31 [Rhipicephalus microplus]|uniref:pre-mRNA processing factor 31 n=1 Tax=Rhipicephalus microplus TaxID=6941 RepID=UPI0018892693|nr:U4/U6 small nuclear ribonucleoprotein Prp31-like [Rhipicephalus microplus]